MTTEGRSTQMIGDLAAVIQKARRCYAERVAGMPSAPSWWTAVIITASSKHQAERYEWEVHRRKERGSIPAAARYLVVPDLQDQRIGSGGATINALHALAGDSFRKTPAPIATLAEWWKGQRVLMIHSGGDSRRLPQCSLSGKLFSALPVKTPWGEASSVFDEMLALSTAWVEKLPAGLLVGSGDVILAFDASGLDWERPGVHGVAIRQPAEVGTRHGVYIADDLGRVYAFLQKPSVADVRAAGGLLGGDEVALDIGLLCFCPEIAARLTELAGARVADGGLSLGRSILETEVAADGRLPVIDLYQHVTMALTGQWTPGPADPPALHALASALKGVAFWCSTVRGDFTHIGTTRLFRKLMTEETEFSNLYAVQQRLGAGKQPSLRSAGVVIESVLSGGELGPGAVAIECNLSNPVHAAAGAVLHGLEGIPGRVEVPEDTVVHQVPVILPDARHGVVIRAYGVADDPKLPAASWEATWFGRPMLEELRNFGMDLAKVWPELPADQWTLWNAQVFPVSTVEEAWSCTCWLLGLSNAFSVERWNELPRASLATSSQWADRAALQAAHSRRLKAGWHITATALAASGADLRPLLVHAPGIEPLAETGRKLHAEALMLEASAPTDAARHYYAAGMFFGHAGLAAEADEAREAAFRMVKRAVQAGSYAQDAPTAAPWRCDEVTAAAPARIDLGGGWSDTPPFCLDWGGTVLNTAVELNGSCPIRTTVRRIPDLVVRCVSSEAAIEYRERDDILRPAFPGDPFSIPRTVLQMTGLFAGPEPLAAALEAVGGGVEIETEVNLPMGSGLGTSSILAATMLRAIAEMMGVSPDNQQLSDQVMRLEQMMNTGGGWQDQADGIFPGAKLVMSGPGLRQRLRVQPVAWSGERAAEFESLMVLYYTGIRRVARDLLQQVVGSYLARETGTVQVLHSIKTIAMEMAYAMQEGEWQYLGELLNRHWMLNQALDPNTTNAPINALLEAVRPYVCGAKLAGAGGGGYLMLLARTAETAHELKRFLAQLEIAGGGAVCEWRIAKEGLRLTRRVPQNAGAPPERARRVALSCRSG
jgi:fucokinase